MQSLKILFYYLQTKYIFAFKDRKALETHQEKLLQQLKTRILKKSSFYKPFLNQPFLNWPLMNKKQMMAHFNQLNTQNMDKAQLMQVAQQAESSRDFTPMINGVTVGLSSGTSGNRGLFIVNGNERVKWVGYMLAKVMPQYFFKKCKIAFFLRANSNLYATINQRKRMQFKFFDLIRDFDKNITDLNAYQPDILIAPAQVLKLLSLKQEKNILNIAPDKIISVAEVLEDHHKDHITKHFARPVHQVYQCTEGFLGTTCQCGTLHINEEWIYLEKEWLDDEKTRFIPIITDLIRESQPIIRYRLDDILCVKKEVCPCGSPNIAIDKVEGRCDEILYLQSVENHTLTKIFPDYITRAITHASSSIEYFHVTQTDVDSWSISLDLMGNEILNDVLSQIHLLCHKLKVKPPKICFTPYINQPLNEKLKRIHRAFNPEESLI